MIFVGLGANLPSRYGAPEQTLEEAKNAIGMAGIAVLASSQTWRSAPVPLNDDPWYCNAVIAVETDRTPREVLETLQNIEKNFGREKSIRNAPRIIDLDLLVFYNVIIESVDLNVPHPRIHERAFVLIPLREIAPDWRHPVTDKTIDELIENLPTGQALVPVERDAA